MMKKIFLLALLLAYQSVFSNDSLSTNIKNGIINPCEDSTYLVLDAKTELTKEEKETYNKLLFNCANNQTDIFLKNPDSVKLSRDTVVKLSHRSPFAAFCWSAVVPGFGQFYNGESKKGALLLSLYSIGWITALTFGYDEPMIYGNPNAPEESSKPNSWFWVGLGACIGSEFWAIIDAPISSNKINENNKNANTIHSFKFQIGPTSNGLGAILSFKY